MYTGTPGDDLFRPGTQRYSYDMTVAIHGGACMAVSAVRKGTMEVGVIEKGIECIVYIE